MNDATLCAICLAIPTGMFAGGLFMYLVVIPVLDKWLDGEDK